MSERVCIVDDCGRSGKLTRGMCSKDYRYWLDHTPHEDRPKPPRLAREFWDFVTKRHNQGCWTWSGPRNRQGYGLWGRVLAHRHSWSLTNGPIPEGMWILHQCDNKPCVNPSHLYAGTRIENVQDAVDRGRVRSPRRDRCSAGHLKVGENLIVVRTGKYLAYRCRMCDNRRKAASARAVRRSRGPLLRSLVSSEERERILDLRRQGSSQRAVAREVGRSLWTVQHILGEASA